MDADPGAEEVLWWFDSGKDNTATEIFPTSELPPHHSSLHVSCG